MTRTPLSRSKGQGQGHQAALLTAVLTHQAAAAESVGTYWPWETTATLLSARRREALRRPQREERGGAAACLQLVCVSSLSVMSALCMCHDHLLMSEWQDTDRLLLFRFLSKRAARSSHLNAGTTRCRQVNILADVGMITSKWRRNRFCKERTRRK